MIELPWASEGTRTLPLPGGELVEIRSCELVFREAQTVMLFASDTYNNKRPQVEIEGEVLLGELAILRLVEAAGWKGVWLDTFHQVEWRHMPYTEARARLPVAQEKLLRKIGVRNSKLMDGKGKQLRSGAWDIFAWKGDRWLFLSPRAQETETSTRIRDGGSKLRARPRYLTRPSPSWSGQSAHE